MKEEEGEIRPLVLKTDRESVLRGEDYWIDYREVKKMVAPHETGVHIVGLSLCRTHAYETGSDRILFVCFNTSMLRPTQFFGNSIKSNTQVPFP